uniref:Uncharacterized protein n=1 Tax=Arundo donax TaxID=35708 RepID=A0A0A8YCJ4_ARUDO
MERTQKYMTQLAVGGNQIVLTSQKAKMP